MGRGSSQLRRVSPGTAGASEPVGGRRPECSAGSRWTSARVRAAATPRRRAPRPAMSPPALAVLGLLLLLLPTGEATKKPTPCKRCRELVDKFNQVGRSLRGDGGGGRGRPAMAHNYPTVGLRSPCRGLGHPIIDWVTPHGLGHPTVDWLTPRGLGHPPMDWVTPRGLGHPPWTGLPPMDWLTPPWTVVTPPQPGSPLHGQM